jgi:hypothetical protein
LKETSTAFGFHIDMIIVRVQAERPHSARPRQMSIFSGDSMALSTLMPSTFLPTRCRPSARQATTARAVQGSMASWSEKIEQVERRKQ